MFTCTEISDTAPPPAVPRRSHIMATEPKGPKQDIEFLWKRRKYLMLLATLVAGVTYAAGLNPPGGVRSEEAGAGAAQPSPAVYPNRVGDPVLVSTYSRRYTAFFYCNAAAFVASLVVIMFLLDRRISGNRVGLTVLRSAMLLDLLALMAAFAAGSCRDVVASIYVSALFALVFVYVAIQVRLETTSRSRAEEEQKQSHSHHKDKERRKFLLLLATFATALTYGVGLAPPGGFWSKTLSGHRAGAPLLHDGRYKIRYSAFFYANATSFVASLAIIMLLMSSTLGGRLADSHALPVCVLVELLGLMAAYAAGSCRWITTTVYIVSLVGAVLLYILLQGIIAAHTMGTFEKWREAICKILTCTCAGNQLLLEPNGKQATPPGNALQEEQGVGRMRMIKIEEDKVEESRSLLLLLATLAATVTYQAGLSPPGGVWPDSDDQGHQHHTPGNPVLLDMDPKMFKAFYYCNSAAFVASLVVIIIVQSKELSSGAAIRRAALKTAMILDLFGLMGAYVAGSFQNAATTIYVLALAVFVFVYSIAKVVAYGALGQSKLMKWMHHVSVKLARVLHHSDGSVGGTDADDDEQLERKRKFLLQLAILAATVTYQTGLNPPGGFWTESNGDSRVTAGDPVLLDHYGIRYQVFFYCNATAFMASVTVILLLVNQKLYRQGVRSNALHVCIMVGLLGLMGAYAAGSCRKLRTSIYVFALVAAVVAFLVLQILLYVSADRFRWSELPWLPQRLKRLLMPLMAEKRTASGGKNKSKEVSADAEQQEQHVAQQKQEQSDKYKRKYLILLGILAASVTYQAGLAPPGGTWGDDAAATPAPSPSASAHPPSVAGNPILLDYHQARYQAFFYCNATSFVASIVVIMLLLQHTVKRRGVPPLLAMQTAVVLDLLGLLGAYAAGSCRDWETSAYVVALVVAVVVFITIYVLMSFGAVLGKAKELQVWKYLTEKKLRLWKHLEGSNDANQPATTVAVTRV